MGTPVLRADSCITWLPTYYMSELMYCMNRWHALHNRVARNTCLKEMYSMRHCPVQHAQLTQIPCLFGSKCRHIGSFLQIQHTSGQSRGSPCTRRFKPAYHSHTPSLLITITHNPALHAASLARVAAWSYSLTSSADDQ